VSGSTGTRHCSLKYISIEKLTDNAETKGCSIAAGDLGATESGMRKLGGTLSILTGVVFFVTALAFFLSRQNS
jgi:hypothetical protein